jgi:hypothetical protein
MNVQNPTDTMQQQMNREDTQHGIGVNEQAAASNQLQGANEALGTAAGKDYTTMQGAQANAMNQPLSNPNNSTAAANKPQTIPEVSATTQTQPIAKQPGTTITKDSTTGQDFTTDDAQAAYNQLTGGVSHHNPTSPAGEQAAVKFFQSQPGWNPANEGVGKPSPIGNKFLGTWRHTANPTSTTASGNSLTSNYASVANQQTAQPTRSDIRIKMIHPQHSIISALHRRFI